MLSETAEFSDIKFIVTMKSDLVPNGAIYEFTEPNYLGRAGVLQKPTMYVKKDKDILRFSCKEILVSIAIWLVFKEGNLDVVMVVLALGGDTALLERC